MPLAEFNGIISGRRTGLKAWLLGSGISEKLAGRELPHLEFELTGDEALQTAAEEKAAMRAERKK